MGYKKREDHTKKVVMETFYKSVPYRKVIDILEHGGYISMQDNGEETYGELWIVRHESKLLGYISLKIIDLLCHDKRYFWRDQNHLMRVNI